MANRRRINRNKDRRFLDEPLDTPFEPQEIIKNQQTKNNLSKNDPAYLQLQESEPYQYEKVTKLEQKSQNYFQPHFIAKNVLNVFDDSVQQIFQQISILKLEQNNKKQKINNIYTNHYKADVQNELNQQSQVQQKKKRVRKERKVIFQEDQINIKQGINQKIKQRNQKQAQKQFKRSPQPIKSLQELVKKKKQQISQSKVVSLQQVLFSCKSSQDKRNAIYTPLKPNEQAFCYFKRFDGMTATFSLLSEQGSILLCSESQRGSIGCNYYISLTKEMDKNKATYLGKLRGNAMGSQYWLYDKGVQPGEDVQRSKWRATHLCVEYESNFLGMKGPRRVEVFCSNLSTYGTNKKNINQKSEVFRVRSEEEYKALDDYCLLKFKNKKPLWNEKIGSYALNFGGKVKEPSIKNFILVKEQYSQEKQLQGQNTITFGKINQTTFLLQYKYPFSLFQAFGTALSQFDFKIQCQ